MRESKLYKITQGGKYIILTTGGMWGLSLDHEDKGHDSGLNLKFYDLLKEVEKLECGSEGYAIVQKYNIYHSPAKFLADGFLEWVRTKHPEIGEFEAEYIGPDISWWYRTEKRKANGNAPEFVTVTEDGHWVHKKTGKNVDELKELYDVAIEYL
ncbi:MAG: hypothetical protein PHQ75_00490 [Thermoguttaceae bacterium]|nr:hypothetical protein [Thermoguttaceae bacterium]